MNVFLLLLHVPMYWRWLNLCQFNHLLDIAMMVVVNGKECLNKSLAACSSRLASHDECTSHSGNVVGS